MRILVTGSSGHLGEALVRVLRSEGEEIVGLDLLDSEYTTAVGSIVDRDFVRRCVEGMDAILHAATLHKPHVGSHSRQDFVDTNVTGTLNLLDGMREAGVGRLVFSSTCATYGQPDRVPIREDESTTPTNPYGESKLAVDRMIAGFCAAHRIGAVSLRYFNVAGASGDLGEHHEPETHLIPNVLRAAAGHAENVSVFGTDYPTEDGTAIRDYIHIEDLAVAHRLALEATRPGEHLIYNLGTGTE